MRKIPIVLLSVFSVAATESSEVKTISWETSHAAPVARLDERQKDLLPLIRLGVSALPEAAVMQMTFIGGFFRKEQNTSESRTDPQTSGCRLLVQPDPPSGSLLYARRGN